MRILGITDRPVVEETPLVSASTAARGTTSTSTRGAWAGRVRRRAGGRKADDHDTVTLHDDKDADDGALYADPARRQRPR